jgi:hypothetical protein
MDATERGSASKGSEKPAGDDLQAKIDAKCQERDKLMGNPATDGSDTARIAKLTEEIVALCDEREKSR